MLNILAQSAQSLVYSPRRIVQLTTLKFHKEDVLERYNLGRPAIYACQIESSDLKALKHRCESAGRAMINCKRDEGLGLGGFASRNIGPFAKDEEPCCIVFPIFDTLCKNIDIVDLCGKFACNRCAGAGCVFLYHLCSSARRTNINPLNTLQVCAEERLALPKRLWMAKYSLDVLNTVQRAGPRLQWRWS